MDFKLITGEIIINAKKVFSKNDISTANRLFYELGYYTDRYNKHWFRHGIFKEIKDVQHMLENDERLNDEEYIMHHNFYIL